MLVFIVIQSLQSMSYSVEYININTLIKNVEIWKIYIKISENRLDIQEFAKIYCNKGSNSKRHCMVTLIGDNGFLRIFFFLTK